MDGHFDAVDLAYLRKLLINASASEHAYWDITVLISEILCAAKMCFLKQL